MLFGLSLLMHIRGQTGPMISIWLSQTLLLYLLFCRALCLSEAPILPIFCRRWLAQKVGGSSFGARTLLATYHGPWLGNHCSEMAFLEIKLREASQAVLGACNAMVPGNGLELMDALMETSDVYRKRYGEKKNRVRMCMSVMPV